MGRTERPRPRSVQELSSARPKSSSPNRTCPGEPMVEVNLVSWLRDSLVGGLEHVDYDFPNIGNNHPNWLSYFSEGLKPPTSSG